MTETALAETANDALALIEKAKIEGCNLLLPSQRIEGLSEFHKPIIERVQLSSNPEEGDVYAHDNGSDGPKKKWRPTKQALMKLSVCAGVIWSVTESKRIDNGADRNYIAYRAVGGIRKADGQPVFFSADYDLDLEVVEEELRESYLQKNVRNKEKGWKLNDVEACVKRDLLQKRKNKLKLCEAGAMNRVLRMLLGIKQAYTTEELSKPFVIMRVVFRPDYNDKEVRARMIDASIKAMTGIYGGDAISQAPTPAAEPIDITPIDEEPPCPPDPEPTAEPEPPQAAEEPKAEEPPTADPGLDFSNMTAEDQGGVIERIAKRKGYDLESYLARSKKAAAKDLAPEKRAEMFAYLTKKAA
jgi:hypothetical protein